MNSNEAGPHCIPIYKNSSEKSKSCFFSKYLSNILTISKGRASFKNEVRQTKVK